MNHNILKIMALLLLSLLATSGVAGEAHNQAKSDMQAGRDVAASASLQALIKQNPSDYQAWFLLGVAQARQQYFHQAIEAFRRVIELKPELAEPHNNLAVIYNELDDLHAAVKELEISLKKRPGYAVAEENVADLYVKMALKNYRSALEKQPNAVLEQRYARLLQVRDPRADTVDTVAVQAVNKDMPQADQQDTVEEKVVAKAVVQKPVAAPTVVNTQHDVKKAEQDVTQIANHHATQAVLAAVEAWRTAWGSQHLEDYFSVYADRFQVPDRFSSLDDWQQYKRRVIGNKTFIDVKLEAIEVIIDQDGVIAQVQFIQHFRSNTYQGDNVKVLEMELQHGAWKIMREESIS